MLAGDRGFRLLQLELTRDHMKYKRLPPVQQGGTLKCKGNQYLHTFTLFHTFWLNMLTTFSLQHTCGTVTLPVRAPACTSMSQAYSSVSLPAGNPSAENIAWARICRPERLRCPSHNTTSTAGRYTKKWK